MRGKGEVICQQWYHNVFVRQLLQRYKKSFNAIYIWVGKYFSSKFANAAKGPLALVVACSSWIWTATTTMSWLTQCRNLFLCSQTTEQGRTEGSLARSPYRGIIPINICFWPFLWSFLTNSRMNFCIGSAMTLRALITWSYVMWMRLSSRSWRFLHWNKFNWVFQMEKPYRWS